jgi:hypothetical protein
MAAAERTCPSCGASVPEEFLLCPSCHAFLRTDEPAPEIAPAPRSRAATEPAPRPAAAKARVPGRTAPTEPGPLGAEFHRRLARLSVWTDAAQPLGIELPRLPAWAERALGNATNTEPWVEVVRGIERLAQQRIVSAFERWDAKMGTRLGRLEAYSVDNRLEREQIEEALHAARVGELDHALTTYQQVDRVVALKERHLDQARDDLEKLVAFLKDLEALGTVPVGEPADVAAALEEDLRAGKLAPLKQQIRSLRQEAKNRLRERLPRFVAQIGDRLVQERNRGESPTGDVQELALGAREIRDGRAEVGAHRLRALLEGRGLGSVGRAAGGTPPPG